MSMMKDAFGWIVGVQKQSIGDLDIQTMESKLRATGRLQDMWEREIKKAETEYREAVSVDANAGRSPIARKLSLQRGAIVAKKIRTLTSAVNMLSKMSGVVDQLKMLKQFYLDLSTTMALPKGLSVEQMIRQVYAMSDKMADKKSELDQIMASLDSANEAITDATGDDEIEKIMDELNKLYDEYNTKVAMNDTEGASAIKVKIEVKKAEMNKQMGLMELV